MAFDHQMFIKKLNDFEIRCLLDNFSNFQLPSFDTPQICKLNKTLEYISRCVVHYEYSKILNINLGEYGFSTSDIDKCTPEEIIEIFLQKKFSVDTDCSFIKQFILLFTGVSALQEFVRCNFTGPDLRNVEQFQLVADFTSNIDISVVEGIIRKLSRDGEFINPNIVNPELLYLSNLFLSSVSDEICISHKWWLLRSIFVHQWVLPERNSTLHNEMVNLINRIFELEWINDDVNVVAKLMLDIECAHIHLYYHEVTKAKKYIADAQMVTGLEISLSGAVGKRTQHQQKAVAQLYVQVQRNKSKLNDVILTDDNCFPCDVALQDDTLLNKVVFIDNDENILQDLSCEEQIVLLGYCCLANRSGAFDELLQEELMAYVNCLLSQPKIWCISIKALSLRCKLEKNNSRRIERSIMQLEEIINAMKKNVPQFSVRQKMLYCSAFPSCWMLEKLLADLLLSVGATNSALEIYERLQLWEDTIICLQRLGRTSSAEKIIYQQLQEKETPLLWCLLGDVTDDFNHYIKAWELSGHRNARSQRSLGYYHFKRKDYKKCLPYFQASLEINHLQPEVWFSLGYAATQAKEFDLAARSYRQVVTLDQDNFEAWNNLSNVYIKTKQKSRAWRSLQEALKCNYEEWRVWENFLLVSVDVGAFEDVIRSYHRLLDIKIKHQDSEVLEILVNAINKDMPDINGFSSARLKKSVLQLFGRITSVITNDAKIWELYSLLYCFNSSMHNKENLERAVQYQQKAVRCYSQKEQWEKEYSSCKIILMAALRLAELTVAYIQFLNDGPKIQHGSSLKLNLQNIISRTEKYFENFQKQEKDDFETILSSLKKYVDNILSL